MKDEVLYRYLNGKTTSEEEQEILAWLDADPVNHIKQLNAIRYICSAVDENIFTQQRVAVNKKRYLLPIRRIFWYAASAAAVILMLIGANYLGRKNTYNNISNRMAAMEVPAGQRIKMTLEDGTVVWLNAGSKLEYPVVFAKQARRVKVSGEAMFEVVHNSEQPFIVETFASEIEVLGTRFNVIAEEKFDRFSTILMEGKVKVSNVRNPGEAIYMKPNEVVNLVNGHLEMEPLTDRTALCWTEGLISIKRMPFDELMAKFERAYAVKIVIDREKMPTINVLNGEVRVADGVDYALRVLQHVADFTYEKDTENNIIVIR